MTFVSQCFNCSIAAGARLLCYRGATMAKANLTLPNGTVVNIEGTPEEVHRLIELNSAGASPRKPESAASHIAGAAPEMRGSDRQGKIDLVEIVNLVRTCDLSTQ